MAVLSTNQGESRAPAVAGHIQSLALGLVIASAIELLVLRTFTRTAIHIPALEQLAEPYELLTSAGRYAYYVAAVLLVIALPVAALLLWREGERAARTGAVAVAAFIVAAGLARVSAGSPLVADTATVVAVIGLAAASAARLERLTALGIMAFATAFALVAGHTLLQTAATEGVGTVDGRWLLYLGELTALVFALSAPWTLHAVPGRKAKAFAVAAGVVVFVMLLGNAATTKILLLWNEGLAGVFPSLAYGVALSALFGAVAGLYARGERLAALGLLMMLIGGFGLHSTYQTGLVVTGLAMLSLSLGVVRETAAE